MKKSAALEEIPDEGWQYLPLREIAHTTSGGTPKRGIVEYYDGDVPWIKSGDLNDGILNECEEYITKLGLEKSSAKLFKSGTLLIALYGATIGRLAILNFEASTNQAVCGINVSDDVDVKYLFYFFLSKRQQLIEQGQGGAQPNINQKIVRETVVPLAPLEEQKCIVAKIEELFSHIDAGIESLKKAKQLLKQYRQSVLKAAVTGELTQEWREANKDKLEPASKLLEHILKERRQKWEVQQLEQFQTKGKLPKDEKWKLKYKSPEIPSSSELPELPDEWIWSGLEQVISPEKNAMKAGPFGSALKKQFYVEKGYKIYGQEQVIKGDPYHGDYYIDEEKYRSLINCAVKPGDFLISLVGTIGRTLVLPDDIEPGIINPRLIKITFDTQICLPEFMQIYVASPAAKQIFRLSSHGGTMDVLNMGTLKALPLPLPSVSEQSVIIQLVEKKEDVVRRQLKYIDKQILVAQKNKNSILSTAFSGKL